MILLTKYIWESSVRHHAKSPGWLLSWLGALVIASVFTGIAHATQRKEHRTGIIASPDDKLRAVMIALEPNNDYGNEESRVEIRDGTGKLLSVKDFSSSDSNHGGLVVDTEWTADSKFFVFSLESSGGHQPWQSPVWFYSRSDRKFREIYDLLGGRPVLQLDAPPFQIVEPDSVKVTTWTRPGLGEKDNVTVVVNLAAPRPSAYPTP
jgi:hypothetical protein